jgi:hypothetical protein
MLTTLRVDITVILAQRFTKSYATTLAPKVDGCSEDFVGVQLMVSMSFLHLFYMALTE